MVYPGIFNVSPNVFSLPSSLMGGGGGMGIDHLLLFLLVKTSKRGNGNGNGNQLGLMHVCCPYIYIYIDSKWPIPV